MMVLPTNQEVPMAMNKFLEKKIFQLPSEVEPVTFWCSDCDAKKVHSSNPATGNFFWIAGHRWNGVATWVKEEPITDYHTVLFALCPGCIANYDGN
jgi:hypothetical protein